MRRFSATVRLSKMPRPSGMVHTPRLALASGAVPLMWTPATCTQPSLGSSVPLINRRRVVFPAPLGPMSANTLASGTRRSTPWTTSMVP